MVVSGIFLIAPIIFTGISDLIRTIKDPEKPNTLEELNVVYEEGIEVKINCCRLYII